MRALIVFSVLLCGCSRQPEVVLLDEYVRFELANARVTGEVANVGPVAALTMVCLGDSQLMTVEEGCRCTEPVLETLLEPEESMRFDRTVLYADGDERITVCAKRP